ncbi:uncharacterized protein Z520_08079 [Fonsecaea multimorphosa CBS 102226]|uniref:C2H2-type domain-containing protein n=1 Tax=Fonsecaea multimorphosa CBS 102226 TaxID=1442371 RepID=A0A0D2IGW7_9EURO|nr:uncharacterized protein Z520_08079 [Fonsecaea multimorphosa CBS 102226]KIX96301.1 hypothetical protein Z520_08079 [Fonsecaea multimorphosa CBS 102226]OAL21962.1 hypothetical protein AYO22_07559 [Fonsecaea multimorphosa]
MIMRDNYPVSPPSDYDTTYTSISTSTPDQKKAHIITMAEEMVPSLPEQSVKIQGAFRRTRSPPRNEQGQMFCDHINCRGKNQTFKRVCEWNKHMDRHERPYKCREAGCELNPGFTYSGGLLRHQREVHKMHLSTKQPLFCPFPNCNRSSGTGFTRKENLEEHKRRRHLEEMSDRDPPHHEALSQPAAGTTTNSAMPQEPAAKRRRISTATEVQGVAMGQQQQQQQQQLLGNEVAPNTIDNLVGSAESQLIQHLRDELRQKEEFIRRQAAEIHRLQNLLRSLPPQAIYHMQNRMPGGGVG